MLAGVLAEQQRLDEANEYVELAREAIPDIDVSGLAQLKISEARVLARRGDLEEAVRLAAEAIAHMDGTEELLNIPDMLLWQAEVLELAGRMEDAAAALTKAAEAAAQGGSRRRAAGAGAARRTNGVRRVSSSGRLGKRYAASSA